MGKKLIFHYDRIGDILYIGQGQPYPEQVSEELGDDVVARMNPQSGEVENVEVLFFSSRLRGDIDFEVPIITQMRLAG